MTGAEIVQVVKIVTAAALCGWVLYLMFKD